MLRNCQAKLLGIDRDLRAWGGEGGTRSHCGHRYRLVGDPRCLKLTFQRQRLTERMILILSRPHQIIKDGDISEGQEAWLPAVPRGCKSLDTAEQLNNQNKPQDYENASGTAVPCCVTLTHLLQAVPFTQHITAICQGEGTGQKTKPRVRGDRRARVTGTGSLRQVG